MIGYIVVVAIITIGLALKVRNKSLSVGPALILEVLIVGGLLVVFAGIAWHNPTVAFLGWLMLLGFIVFFMREVVVRSKTR